MKKANLSFVYITLAIFCLFLKSILMLNCWYVCYFAIADITEKFRILQYYSNSLMKLCSNTGT